MNTYLVPTDFSENANNAIEYAAEIAHATGRKLLLLHVHQPSLSSYSFVGVLVANEVESAIAQAKNKLEVIQQTLSDQYPELVCTTLVTVGEIVDQIVAVADHRKAELIIMGTYGTKVIDNMLFGSHTQTVIDRAHCPVLSVPSDVPFRVPYKMLFATNFAFHDLRGAVQMTAVARAFGATLIIAHVMVDDRSRNHEQELIEAFTSELKSRTDYEEITNLLISDKTVNRGLDAVIAETQADMIALSMQKRGLFEQFFNPGITRKLSSHGVIPLLAFHATEEVEAY